MATYFIKFEGVAGRHEIEQASIEEARDAAVVCLGEYLRTHPGFAYERHWRVDLLDHAERLLLHVIVATVEAPKPLNWASFDETAT